MRINVRNIRFEGICVRSNRFLLKNGITINKRGNNALYRLILSCIKNRYKRISTTPIYME